MHDLNAVNLSAAGIWQLRQVEPDVRQHVLGHSILQMLPDRSLVGDSDPCADDLLLRCVIDAAAVSYARKGQEIL